MEQLNENTKEYYSNAKTIKNDKNQQVAYEVSENYSMLQEITNKFGKIDVVVKFILRNYKNIT